jgi:DNA polymerase-3 subunit gamma/tau
VGGAAPDDSDPEAADTARLAGMMAPDETQLLYSICLHGRADLGLAPDEYAALTMVLLRLLAFKPKTAEKKTLSDTGPRPIPAQLPVKPSQPAQSIRAATSAQPKPVQPWEDEPDAVPVGHGGQQIPVREAVSIAVGPSEYEKKRPVTPAGYTQAATKLVAVPVRQQSETRSDAVAAQAPPVLLPTEEGDFWHTTVQQLIASESVSALVRELALQSQLVARDTDQWLLRVERESLNQTASRERLSAALQQAGHPVRLAVEVGRVTDCPARRNGAAVAEKQLAAEKIIFDDPFVQAMMRDFGAKIVPGSIKPL